MTVKDLIEVLQQAPDQTTEALIRLRIGDGAVRLDIGDVTHDDRTHVVLLEVESA